MANLFLNLPMPAGDGPGASVNTSAMGKDKSIVIGGSFDNASVSVEASANGVDFESIWLFDKPGKKVIDVAAQSMRVNVQGRNFAPFNATADVGANDNGALFVNLPLPAVDGVGAAVDVSALGNFTTFIAGGTFRNVSIFVEASEDGVEYAQCTRNFSNIGGIENKVVVANFMRTRVIGRLNNPFPFSLMVAVGATSDPGAASAILAANNTWTAAQVVAPSTLAYGANVGTDAALSNVFDVTLAGVTAQLDNPTNLIDGQTIIWRVAQDGTGSRALTFGTNFDWGSDSAPDLTTEAAGALSIITGITNGTKIFVTAKLGFIA